MNMNGCVYSKFIGIGLSFYIAKSTCGGGRVDMTPSPEFETIHRSCMCHASCLFCSNV